MNALSLSPVFAGDSRARLCVGKQRAVNYQAAICELQRSACCAARRKLCDADTNAVSPRGRRAGMQPEPSPQQGLLWPRRKELRRLREREIPAARVAPECERSEVQWPPFLRLYCCVLVVGKSWFPRQKLNVPVLLPSHGALSSRAHCRLKRHVCMI